MLMEIRNPKYNVGDKVYLLKYDKLRSAEVTKIIGKVIIRNNSRVIVEYSYHLKEVSFLKLSIHSGRPEQYFKEKELYSSKEELIATL